MRVSFPSRLLFAAGALVLAMSCSLAAAGEIERAPTPEPELLQRARKLVKEVYESDFERAKTPSAKEQLAKKFIDHAKLNQDDAASRYALLEQARGLAIEAGAVKLAVGAASELGQFTGFKEFDSKMDALIQLSGGNRPSTLLAQVAEQAVDALEEALAAEQFEQAEKMGALAEVVAAKTKDAALKKRIPRRHQIARELLLIQRQFVAATARLEKDVDDTTASAVIGRYHCLVRGDWERGLPMLATGNDENAKLAQREIRGPINSKEQLALADDWWSQAENLPELLKPHAWERADHWYAQAVESLTGLERSRVQKRRDELARALKSAEFILASSDPSKATINQESKTAAKSTTTDTPKNEPSAKELKGGSKESDKEKPKSSDQRLVVLSASYVGKDSSIDLTDRLNEVAKAGVMIVLNNNVLGGQERFLGNLNLKDRQGRELVTRTVLYSSILFIDTRPMNEKRVLKGLAILDAYYGAGIVGEKTMVDVKEDLESMIEKDRLILTVRDLAAKRPDPCFGVSKQLILRYSLDGRIKIENFEEHMKVEIGKK